MITKKTMTFHAYSDPGHGWLKVPKALIRLLGISDKISEYSYQKGGYAFLEEDCDASFFLCTLSERGIEYSIKHHSTDRRSKIRSYERFCNAA